MSVSYTHLDVYKRQGKNCQVYVCVTPDGKALYFEREKKGHEGVKGTVTEDYQGILVHDHDLTFYPVSYTHLRLDLHDLCQKKAVHQIILHVKVYLEE